MYWLDLFVVHFVTLSFWQRQSCTRRGFYTHTPPPKKWIKKVVKKPNRLLPNVLKFLFSIWTNSSRLFVCALHKINKQKAVNKSRHLLPYVMKFLAFGLTVFGFLYVHYTNKIKKQKIVNKPNVIFSIWTSNIWLFVCAQYI